MTRAVDTDDPERLAAIAWAGALAPWLAGDPAPMAAWLRDPAVVITDDAREFLAELACGKVKRPRGRRARRPAHVERAIVAEVYAARERWEQRKQVTNPHDRAIEEVAKARRPMSVPTVRGIVDRLTAAGVTFDAWRAWGRPTFTQT